MVGLTHMINHVEDPGGETYYPGWPNPVSDLLTISTLETAGERGPNISNAASKIVYCAHSRQLPKQLQIPVASWPAGIYFVQFLRPGKSVYTKKILVKR